VDHWDGWMTAIASRARGGPIDLLRRGTPASLDPPPGSPWSGQGFRGTLLLDSVTLYPNLFGRPYLRYLCRQWNRDHPEDPVEEVDLQRVYVDLERPGSPPTERRRVARLRCPSGPRAAFATLPEIG
jgi:hypothetical protein